MTAPRIAIALLAVILAARGCSEGKRVVYDRPNVLLITLDTVRADRMSCYGAERKTTPRLDEFAAEAARFESCYSQSSFTPPSHASILTSRYVSSHGVKWWNYALDESVRTLAEAFQSRGFATACFTPLTLASNNNLQQGFDRVEELAKDKDAAQKWKRKVGKEDLGVAPGSAVRERFEAWLASTKQPFFSWVHFYDAHRPYAANAPERQFCADKTAAFGDHLTRDYQLKPGQRTVLKVGPAEAAALVDRYDSGLLGLDREVGLLLDRLRASGVLDKTIVVITSDHGEAFAEFHEEWFTHDPFLHDAVTHVPLLVRFPDGKFAGDDVEPIVESIDIAPTLLDYCGLPLEPGMQGQSLRPVLEDGRAVRAFAFSERQARDHDDRDAKRRFTDAEIALRRSIRGKDLRLVVEGDNGARRLFDRDAEPFEQNDVLGADAERARSINTAFDEKLTTVRRVTPTAQVTDLSDEQRRLMEEQGYLGGEPASAPASAPASSPATRSAGGGANGGK